MKKNIVYIMTGLMCAMIIVGCAKAEEHKLANQPGETAESNFDALSDSDFIIDSIDEPEAIDEKFSKETADSIRRFRIDLQADGGILGVSYLGYLNPYENITMYDVTEAAKEIYADEEWFKEIASITQIEQPGGEVYLLVPQSAECVMTIYGVIWGDATDDGMPQRGDVLYVSEQGEPVIVICNESDIVSNVEIELDMAGTKFSYCPSLSLENGKILEAEGVVDFTRYDDMKPHVDGADD